MTTRHGKEKCPQHGCRLAGSVCPECSIQGESTPFPARSSEDVILHGGGPLPAEQGAIRVRVALEAIREALNEGEHRPMKGYHPARALADEWGIYNDNLEGSRVLYLLASAALGL